MSPLSIYVAIALIAASMGSVGAWRVQSWRHAAKDAARIEQQVELVRNNRKAAQVASEGFEDDRTKTEIRYRTIAKQVEKIIDRPVYRATLCMDNDGLRILNAAIGAAGDTGQPQDAVPEPR